jgi:hypothetical protein
VTRLVVTGLPVSEADAVVRLALGQRVDPAELAMAAGSLGGAGKRSRMIGAEGVQVTSKELTRGKGWRMDLENPNRGQLPAQIHVQDYRGNKWQYDLRLAPVYRPTEGARERDHAEPARSCRD